MNLPLTFIDLLRCVATETARMSYPGSMSRGNRPVVYKETKKSLEEYFCTEFPLADLLNSAENIARQYDDWHYDRVNELSAVLTSQGKVANPNLSMPVAAKFINTFMHQLMKYEKARPIFSVLHLPLDARVFGKLRSIRSPALANVRQYFRKSPYSLDYTAHCEIQEALCSFIAELNARQGMEFHIESRIELNWLWL